MIMLIEILGKKYFNQTKKYNKNQKIQNCEILKYSVSSPLYVGT